MLLEGPIIKDKMADTYPPVITAAQILKFKSIKTSKHKELVDRLPTLDLSISYDIISYDRVLLLSAQIGNNVCQHFTEDNLSALEKCVAECS